MDFRYLTQYILLALAPTGMFAAVVYGPRFLRFVKERVDEPVEAEILSRPIEDIAADLWRLLRMHERLRNSVDIAMRRARLSALEAAISDCAAEAARALDVQVPKRPAHQPIPQSELRRLLHALSECGLVLPSDVGILRWDTPQ